MDSRKERLTTLSFYDLEEIIYSLYRLMWMILFLSIVNSMSDDLSKLMGSEFELCMMGEIIFFLGL